MKTKLLSLKQKRELLQRMAATVRRGGKLDAFCKKEGIERETLFDHLIEMRAIGTKGINPFLPDLEEGGKYTRAQKIRAAKKIEAYAVKTNISRALASRLVLGSKTLLTEWKQQYNLPRANPKYTEVEKRRIVRQVGMAVKKGMKLQEALKKFGVCKSLLQNWEKKYDPDRKYRRRWQRYGMEEKKRIAHQIVANVNSGMTVLNAVKKAGIGISAFQKWERQYATIKRIPYGQRKRPDEEKKRVVRQFILSVNNGMTVADAAKKTGFSQTILQKWEKQFATIKRVSCYARQFSEEAKKQIVRQVIADVNSGMMVKDALAKAGINRASLLDWEKLYGLTGRKKRFEHRQYSAQEQRRITDQVIANANNGMTMTGAAKKEGIGISTFYKWEKQHATLKRKAFQMTRSKRMTPQERKRMVNQVITDVNGGMTLKDAVKKAGTNIATFQDWEKQHATLKRKVSPLARPKRKTSPQAVIFAG